MSVKLEGFIKGPVKHRRTELDYMSTLLDVVTLDEWRVVVEAALTAARSGDAGARNWLAQYLVGKPGTTAQPPVEIVAHRLSGRDPLVETIAQPHITAARYPVLAEGEELDEHMRALVAAELLEAEEEELQRASAKERRSEKCTPNVERDQDTAG